MHQIDQGTGGGLPQPTMAGGAQQLRKLPKVLSGVAGGGARMHLIEGFRNDLRAGAARGAESTAFVGKKVGEVAHDCDGVALSRKHHEAAAARYMGEINGGIELMGK